MDKLITSRRDSAWSKQKGFTIVELLIVIVVIAILATITVIGFNGVQNRANDVAVQSDLRSFGSVIGQKYAVNGVYPKGGSASGDSTRFPDIEFSPSKDSYSTELTNFYYCEGQKSGRQEFVIGARSKPGTDFIYDSTVGSVQKVNSSFRTMCMDGWDGSSRTYSYGYYKNDDKWWPWTK